MPEGPQATDRQLIIDEVAGALAVPTANAGTNTLMSEVVGNKGDNAVTTVGTVASLVAYVKGLLGQTVKPAADSTNNATLADVVGSKDDASQTTVGTTRSLMGYVKGIVSRISAPNADETGVAWMTWSIGNKADTARTTVGATYSIMSYVKGVIQHFTWTVDQDTQPSLANVTTEQDVIVGATSTPGDLVVWGLNLGNLAVASTVRVYMKLDAATYAEVEALRQSVSAGKSAAGNFRVSVSGSSATAAYKVTLQAAAPPGTPQIYAQARRRAA